MRAVTLMVRNAVREFGEEGDFVGHLDDEDLIIITTPDVVHSIRGRIERRIHQSREYFYPIKDRQKAQKAMQEHHLTIKSGVVQSTDKTFADVDSLKKALTEALIEE